MDAPHPCTVPRVFSRRDFLARAALGAVATGLAPSLLSAQTSAPAVGAPASAAGATRFEIGALEKHFFERYTPAELAQTYDEMGLDVELTLRPEGHVKPENAASELPAYVEALKQRNRRILILATSFVRPDAPHIADSLRAAQKLGIRHYRHRGFAYKPGTPIKAQIADFRSQAREFAAMNKEIGVTALYQNHAGADYVGAALWDIDEVLDDIPPEQFALALDTRHLLVELGRAWPSAVRMIAPRVGSLFVKDFTWDRNRTIETPLSRGNVTKEVVEKILAGRGPLPVCLHVEHLKLQPIPFAERAATVEAFRADARVLRGWLGET